MYEWNPQHKKLRKNPIIKSFSAALKIQKCCQENTAFALFELHTNVEETPRCHHIPSSSNQLESNLSLMSTVVLDVVEFLLKKTNFFFFSVSERRMIFRIWGVYRLMSNF